MDLDFDASGVKVCSDWLLSKLAEENGEMMVKLATGLWGIWSSRNLKVWEDKIISPEIAVQMSVKQVAKWCDM